ncbi:MAG: CBM20 domain-containing protein [Bacteroidota bacterium]
MMLRYSILAMILLISGGQQVWGQTLSFAVDMQYAYLQPGDRVVVRGNITELGNWTAEGELVLTPQSGSKVFTGQLDPQTNPPAPIWYKYVILRTNGAEEWEERGNRVYTAAGRASQVPVWFNDRQTPGIRQTVTQVLFTLDVTGFGGMDSELEAVALMGGRAPLSFELEQGRKSMTQTGEHKWEVSVNFPAGTQPDIPFKFVFQRDGEWQWEWRPGHTNHVVWLEDIAGPQTVSMRYDLDQVAFVPTSATMALVDDYQGVMKRLGDISQATRYGYASAMQALEAGELAEARSRYRAYRAEHAGGEEIDDFEYRYAYKLWEGQGLSAALAHIDKVEQTEQQPKRLQYLEYLKGELNLHAGNREQARYHFMQAQAHPANWDMVMTYSRQAVMETYLQSSSPDSVRKGIRMMERRLQEPSATNMNRRKLLLRLERAYAQADMSEKQQKALRKLSSSGTRKQQVRGALKLAEQQLRHNQPEEALLTLETIATLDDFSEWYQRQYTRLQLTGYYQTEQYIPYTDLYEIYLQRWPEDAYARRLAKWNTYALQHTTQN